MSSKSIWRTASAVSPALPGSISVNIPSITTGQPSRISDNVPSKSKSACVISGLGANEAANSIRPENSCDMRARIRKFACKDKFVASTAQFPLTHPMRSARALWGFLIFVFIGAALVSPWIYHACVAFGLTGIPFRRVVDRCLIVLAVVALWPFVKALGVRSRKELGLKNYPTLGRDLATGFAIGIALLVIAAAFSMAAGASHWVPRNGWPKQIGSAIATAVAVALLEEILFRGAIYTGLTRIWGALAGLWVSSGLYAILHFFARPENPAVIDWKAGFVVLGRM